MFVSPTVGKASSQTLGYILKGIQARELCVRTAGLVLVPFVALLGQMREQGITITNNTCARLLISTFPNAGFGTIVQATENQEERDETTDGIEESVYH